MERKIKDKFMYICERCGKGIMRGNAVSHAKNRSKKIFMPNLHTVKALINGQPKNIRVCTKCLRKVTKAPKRDLSKVIKKVTEVTKVTEVVKEEIKEAPKKKRGRAKKNE